MTRSIAFLMFCGFLLMASLVMAQEEVATGPFSEVQTVICSAVEDREPVGEAASFGSDVGQVFLWTKLIGATDSTMVKHVWFYNGEEMAAVDLPVKSSMWRTWSSKKILPSWTGNWEVKVMDAEGNILKAVSFTIDQIAPAAVELEMEAPAEPTPEPEGDST